MGMHTPAQKAGNRKTGGSTAKAGGDIARNLAVVVLIFFYFLINFRCYSTLVYAPMIHQILSLRQQFLHMKKHLCFHMSGALCWWKVNVVSVGVSC